MSRIAKPAEAVEPLWIRVGWVNTLTTSPVLIAVGAAVTTVPTRTRNLSESVKREPIRFLLFFVEELICRFLRSTVPNRYKEHQHTVVKKNCVRLW